MVERDIAQDKAKRLTNFTVQDRTRIVVKYRVSTVTYASHELKSVYAFHPIYTLG